MKKFRFQRFTVLCFLCLSMSAASLMAGTTGKIVGTVIDQATKEPLIGANVLVIGTSIGSLTDMDGYYMVMNLPPGIYSVRITMLGYKTLITELLKISIDRTTTLDAALEPTVLQTDETVTVVAERPLVQKDMTSSLSSVNSEEIKNLPVQSIGDVLQLQAGVVRDGNNFHIRGGRTGEVSYWVDGIATNEVFSGGNAVTVENSAVQEMQVVSGTFNAEYGNAMSGIVNIITKEGKDKFEGRITAYAGDYLSGRDVYGVLRKVTPVTDPATGVVKAVEDLENPLKKFNPVYNTEVNLSGPVPFFNNKLSFFVNGRYFSQEGYQYGRRWYLPQGIAGDSALVPLDPYQSYSGMGKLTYKISDKIKVNYSLFLSQGQNDRGQTFNYDRHLFKYNPDGTRQGKSKGVTHMFGWNHVLSSKTFYDAKISHIYNEYQQYLYEDSTLHPNYFIKVLADTSGPEYTAQVNPNSDEGKALLEQLKITQRQYQFVVDPANSEGYVHPDSLRDPAAFSFWRAGTDPYQFHRTTSYWIGKWDLTSQVNKVHLVKTGFEIKLHELSLNSYMLQAKLKDDKDEQIVPYEPTVPPASNIYHYLYTRKPREFSAYLQDKIELKDLIVNIGVRFDYFDPNGTVPVDPMDPSIYTPYKMDYIYKNYITPPDSVTGAALSTYNQQFTQYTPDERRAFMQKKSETNMQLSPRIGIAYPITDRGIIHFSYGHFFQAPEFQYLYDNPDFKLFTGGGNTLVGNANIKPQRTVQYEIGLQQQISDNVGLDLTLFYKDIRDWVGTSPLQKTYRPSVAYSTYENKDYANVYGVTMNMEKRFANHFGASASYYFQVAEGTYSNPNDAYNAIQSNLEPRLALIPLGWDQRHTFMSTATIGARGWTLTFQGKYQTGRPYTPSITKGAQVGASTYSGYRDNSARLPNTSSLDILLHKRFQVGSFNIGLLVTIYNVLDQAGATAVYSDTGSPSYTTNTNPSTIDYVEARVGTVEDLLRRPDWYIAPRQVQAGLTFEF